ncbi:MAG: hypothetical protein IJO32_02485 [Bacilli bacterium]|nr:hypothetical protein [Bacilli bacterium]
MENGICFLDFDGVVNTLKIEYKNGKFNTKYYYKKNNQLSNEQAILWISKLCLENSLDIVVTSNWRNHCTMDELKQILYNSGLVSKVNILGMIKENTKKSEAIEDFLDKVGKYVIIDDEQHEYLSNNDALSHLVLCDPYYGFGIYEYEKAKSILKNKTLIKK